MTATQKRGASYAENLAARRRTAEAGNAAKPQRRASSTLRLEDPLTRQPEGQPGKQEEHRNPQGRGHGGGAFGGAAESRGGNIAAVGEQQFRLLDVVRRGVRRRVKRKLVTKSPGKDTDRQQDEGWREKAQTSAAAGQANAASNR